jgi:SNF2 family DNA or RNA helicase
MDVNWNPSSDNEACCRVYRFGQKKPVYIYRLVTTNTIEDKVLARQLQKEVLSAWVIDNNDKRVTDHVNPKVQQIP